MTQNNMKNIEEIIDSLEATMKKGFINGLILLVLDNEPSHGYKILKEIEERTLGFWQPTSSTIYPLLDSLNKKGLIDLNDVEQDETGRQKKIYKITSKGEETLKMILQKHQIMTESIKSIIISTLGITDETEPAFLEDLDKLISFPGMDIIKEKTLESKIEVLKDHKKLIAHRIEVMSYNHKKIDKILSQLEKGGNNRDVDLPSKNIASH